MAELIDANDIMFTPFEPKLKNRFIMNIDGIPAYTIKTATRPQVTFDEVEMHQQLVRANASLEQAVTEVIRMVPSAVAMLNDELEVIHFNHEFSRLFGVEKTQGSAAEFDISALHECCAEMMRNGHGHANIDEMQTPSGRLADIRMNMMDDGGVMVSATDITDHKRKEQMLLSLLLRMKNSKSFRKNGRHVSSSVLSCLA